jgi:FMN phosphatase YigB (HAD superfamily)
VAASRLLLFDLDDTLIDRDLVIAAWSVRFAAAHALDTDAVAWLLTLDRHGLTPRAQFLAATRERYALAEPLASLLAAYERDYPALVEPVADELLEALSGCRRRGWRLGVVTNGPAYQETVIRNAGLAPLLDGWCVSELEGRRKPDPALFALAAARVGAELRGGFMVGDSAEADIAGAHAAGLRSVWLARGRRWPQGSPPPSYRADSILEAIALVLAHPAA